MIKAINKFAKIYTLLFKHYSKNHTLQELIEYHDRFGKNGTLITYGDALDKFRSICTSDSIMALINELQGEIEPIKDYRFEIGYDSVHNLLPIEYKLNTMMLRGAFKNIQNDTNIKNASKITGISESAIKQACQQGRLINTCKSGKSWIVNLNEIKEYWGLEP